MTAIVPWPLVEDPVFQWGSSIRILTLHGEWTSFRELRHRLSLVASWTTVVELRLSKGGLHGARERGRIQGEQDIKPLRFPTLRRLIIDPLSHQGMMGRTLELFSDVSGIALAIAVKTSETL